MVKRHIQQGLSLTELMVALAIGTVLLLGVFGVFVSNSQSDSVETAINRVQQAGRAAVELLNRDIRRAGYIGCRSIGGSVLLAASNTQVHRLLAYRSYGSSLEPDSTNSVADVVKGAARADSDVIVLDYADYLGNDLIAEGDAFDNFSFDNQSLTLKSASGGECRLVDDDLLLLSNCVTTHVFRVSSASVSESTCGASGNTITINSADNQGPAITAADGSGPAASSLTGFRYAEQSDVAEYLQFIWFVADTGREINGQTVYALYRLASNQVYAQREEMIEGVEFLRVEVGERVAGGLRFVPPSVPGINWSQVESVRMALLVQSFESVTDAEDTRSYQLLSDSIPASGTIRHGGGRVIRRVYTSSQAIRNTAYGQF